jgi:N-methylhydantoinase A
MIQTARVGIDIGGTFTDGVLVDQQSGAVQISKVLTTPRDQSQGFLAALQALVPAEQAAAVRTILHATTTATNAVLERRGAQVALITTRGFRDILEIGRQIRSELYDLQTDKPAPLVPRRLCFEVGERLHADGSVLEPLDETSVAGVIAAARAEGVTTFAICLLHAYRNPAHEQRVAALLRSAMPDADISVSSAIAPQIREYWRASTAVLNAYVAPIVRRYLQRLAEGLDAGGYRAPLLIMQSSGGVAATASAAARPVAMLESGPAAGVAAAAFFAELAGFRHALSFDMGGTTAKAGLVMDGRPSVLPEFEAGGHQGSGVGVARGSGYPVLTPVVDLVEISAGGGSQAWIDSGGLLRVGPHSAGAEPGPACYGRGGTQPTVTDANLVLGRLNPSNFLGGRMALDAAAAEQAFASAAAELQRSVRELAAGVTAIAEAAMLQALRLVTVQRGHHPADLALVGFGGAGPLHAVALGRELGVAAVVIPPGPGVASALGLLVSDLRIDVSRSWLQPLADADADELERQLAELTQQALAELQAEANQISDVRSERRAELRYRGQSWRLAVTLPDTPLTAADLVQAARDFDREHERRYGYAVANEAYELAALQVTALGGLPRPQLPDPPAEQRGRPIAQREVVFSGTQSPVAADVYRRAELGCGQQIDGPALIEEMDSTTVLPPGCRAEVGRGGVLTIRWGDRPA